MLATGRSKHASKCSYVRADDSRQGVSDFEEVSCVRLVNPGEITGLAFDTVSNRLAVCHRHGVVQLYTLDSCMNLHLLYSLSISNSSPKAVAFGALCGSERDILVFGLYNGVM